MITKVLDEREDVKEEDLIKAAESIKEGKLVIFPTETVYGIGANALNKEAVEKIFAAKGRESDNPLIVHISNLEMLENIAKNIGKIEKKLIEKFWPGPLTIVFDRKDENVISNKVTAGLDTVGVRMPSNLIARKLINIAGVPVAAPSANVSGKPSGTNIQDIIQEFDEKVEYIIDGGSCQIGLESTVIRVINDKIHILRPGKITLEDLEEVAKNVDVDEHILKNVTNEKVMSPGMKYRHYAPNTKCVLVYSKDEEKLIDKINEITKENMNVLVLGTGRNIEKYIAKNKINMGNSLEDIGKNIFTILRKVDKYEVDLVIIEGVGKEKLGLAITNRLIRACEYNYIEI